MAEGVEGVKILLGDNTKVVFYAKPHFMGNYFNLMTTEGRNIYQLFTEFKVKSFKVSTY